MQTQKNQAGNLLPMIVTEGVTVNVMPNEAHEYLMTSKEIAHGYGTSDYIIRKTKERHEFELTEGKHYIKGVTLSHTLVKGVQIQPHAIFWTKRGIVRLGFFIKSERARLFRDWAEELIINVTEQPTLFSQQISKQLPEKRKHNRLTQERLADILAEVCRIENHEIRMSITDKLMGGRN